MIMKKLRPPMQYNRLRDLSSTNKDPLVQELLWEIRRLHDMLSRDRQDVIQLRVLWAQEVGGNLALIHQMLQRLTEEPAAFGD